MATNITGAGFFFTRIAGKLHPLFLSSFAFAEEMTTADAEGYSVGDVAPLQVLDTVTQSSKWTITASLQAVDQMDIQRWLFGQESGSISVSVPMTKTGIIPTSSPYTITETGLLVDQDVDATRLSDTSPGKAFLSQVAGVSPIGAAGFKVTADTLTFNVALAGKTVAFYYMKSLSALNSVGGINAIAGVGTMEMVGKYGTSRTGTRNIWFPKLKYDSGVKFDIKGDMLERTLRASVPTELGWTLPYMEWQSP